MDRNGLSRVHRRKVPFDPRVLAGDASPRLLVSERRTTRGYSKQKASHGVQRAISWDSERRVQAGSGGPKNTLVPQGVPEGLARPMARPLCSPLCDDPRYPHPTRQPCSACLLRSYGSKVLKRFQAEEPIDSVTEHRTPCSSRENSLAATTKAYPSGLEQDLSFVLPHIPRLLPTERAALTFEAHSRLGGRRAGARRLHRGFATSGVVRVNDGRHNNYYTERHTRRWPCALGRLCVCVATSVLLVMAEDIADGPTRRLPARAMKSNHS